MAKQKDGGNAFPTVPITGDRTKYSGMTLRDYFAGQALAGIAGTCLAGSGMVSDEKRSHTVAVIAYAMADAMLTEREREKGGA